MLNSAANDFFNGKFQLAAEKCQQLLQTDPHHPYTLYLLGLCFHYQNDQQAALTHIQQAIQKKPHEAEFLYAHGMLQLFLGNYQEGWSNYEFRLKCKNANNTHLPIPRWQGQILKGQERLLVLAEQGYGDTFQFLRYLPLLRTYGKHIIFLVPSFLQNLLIEIPGIDYCSADDYQDITADYYVELMSLPYLTRRYTAPRVDLFSTSHSKHLIHQLPIQPNKKNIGLVWSSSKKLEKIRKRSCHFDEIKQLFKLKNINFYGLQYGDDQQLANTPNFQNLSHLIHDFADTATIMSHLDLVISVDTSAAHLAASLNVPVWLMLPHVADWRWQHNCADSPWYPSMHLFRQNSADDWTGVITSIVNSLRRLDNPG